VAAIGHSLRCEPRRRRLFTNSVGKRLFVANRAMESRGGLRWRESRLAVGDRRSGGFQRGFVGDGATLWWGRARKNVVHFHEQFQLSARTLWLEFSPILACVSTPREALVLAGAKLALRLDNPRRANHTACPVGSGIKNSDDLTASSAGCFSKWPWCDGAVRRWHGCWLRRMIRAVARWCSTETE